MIHWQKIRNGHRGFEELATEYVEKEFQFPHGHWKQTQQTHDGNRDAYTVIIGYHPYGDGDETWWMEAKYSSAETRKYLTRFRLDATIVSSIFHKQVTKIVFVTNINVHAKTISDVRLALQKSIGCEDVYFCTRATIEYWLVQNPEIYRRFFDEPFKAEAKNIPIFISEEVSLYPYPSHTGHMEPCAYVYVGHIYTSYFKVVSPSTQSVSITAMQAGIEVKTERLQLLKGENAVQIDIVFTEDFSPVHIAEDGRESCNLEFFQLAGELPVLLKKSVQRLERTSFRLNIRSQNDALSALCGQLEQFRSAHKPAIAVLSGQSGTGKTYITQKMQQLLRRSHVTYCNFSEDPAKNNQKLLQLICFILFPYVDPEEIDSKYLRELGETTNISKSLIELVRHRKNPAALEKAMRRHCARQDSLFSQRCELNERYLLLDNMQNLSEDTGGFLLALIREIKEKRLPLFFLLSGQSVFLESRFYRTLRQENVVNDLECLLEYQDVVENIRVHTSFDLTMSPQLTNTYFPNLILLLEFLKFAQTGNASEMSSLNDFFMLYISFVNSGLGEDLILDQFAHINAHEDMKKLCYAIYTAPNGIPAPLKNEAAGQLLKTGLVKINEENLLVPFHDIYVDFFRKANQTSKREMGIPFVDAADETRDTVLYSANPSELDAVSCRITELRKNGKFYSVCYILDTLFQSHGRLSAIRLNNKDAYYQLYFDYAYAVANCSRRYTGCDYFEKLYQEIRENTSIKLRILQLELLFELINGNYNIFHYRVAMERYREFQNLMTLLIRSGSLSPDKNKNLIYCLCENMRIMIQASRGKKKSEKMFLRWREVLKSEGYTHHYIDFHIRYAHTLYTVDMEKALTYTEEAYASLPDDEPEGSKLRCLVAFQYCYLRLLQHRDFTMLTELESITDSAKKEYYSSYRHRNLALCALYYMIGDVSRADERFFSDMANPRLLRDKLHGYYFETLALHYLSCANYVEATTALEQAHDIFAQVPSYLQPVRHNLKVLSRGLFSPKRMDIYLGQPLKRDWYYIDPRAD